MKKIIENYILIDNTKPFHGIPLGDSASPKEIIFHIFPDNKKDIKVIDIGFGAGNLGKLIKANPETNHWSIDAIDGWEANCYNEDLINNSIYRNIWHGLAQELSHKDLQMYDAICMLDVIEHLNENDARSLIKFLLNSLGDESLLFISTPLWFYPQDSVQKEDLEEHLIGIPASSMMAMLPRMYSINHPLIGGFVYGKESVNFSDFFQPSSNKEFTYEMGLKILNSVGVQYKPGTLFKCT